MHIEFALLADAAVVHADGRFDIHGGNFARVYMPGFPGSMTPFVLAVGLRVDRRDDTTHVPTLRVEFWEADRADVFQPIQFNVTLSRLNGMLDDSTLVLIPIAFPRPELPSVEFRNPGYYEFRVSLDGQSSVIVPLIIDQYVPPHP